MGSVVEVGFVWEGETVEALLSLVIVVRSRGPRCFSASCQLAFQAHCCFSKL